MIETQNLSIFRITLNTTIRAIGHGVEDWKQIQNLLKKNSPNHPLEVDYF